MLRKKNYIQIGIALLFFLVIVIAYVFRVDKKISLTFLQEHHLWIQTFIQQHYVIAVMSYLIVYASFVVLMLPITLLLTIASGYFFGVLPGTCYSIAGSALGSLLSFLIFRYVLREWATKRYHKKLAAFEQDFDKHSTWYLLSLLLLPITPFALINVLAALSHIEAWKYICIVIIGITPYTFLYAFAGRKLVELTTTNDIFSPWFIMLSLIFSLCSLAPIFIQCIYKKMKK